MADWDALVPDPLVSDRQYRRFHHLDMSALNDADLTDELNHLRSLLWGFPDAHWLRQRVGMIETEIRKRRGDTTYKSSRRRKPKLAEGVVL